MLDTKNIIHAHEDDLELYARGRLEPQHTSVLESHLLECLTCRERLSQCIGSQFILHPSRKAKSREKYERSEVRFTTGDDAIVQELSPLSMDHHRVQIVDISKNGLGIICPKSVLPGTIVQVRIKTQVELGEVRHCSPWTDKGYRIGLRLHGQF
jgi:hypothetical protein